MWRQCCHYGKHPNAMIKDRRALLDNTQDPTHRVAIYSWTQELIKHTSCNLTYISDEPLHSKELRICHGSMVHVEGLEGECISISKTVFGPEAIRKFPRHSGSPCQCFKVLPDTPSPPWSFSQCSQTLQEHSQVLLKAPAVMEVHSGCYKIWLLG